MLKGKRFAKKTKRGSVIQVNREHYLRDDIWCGVKECTACKHAKVSSMRFLKKGKKKAVFFFRYLPAVFVYMFYDDNTCVRILNHQCVCNYLRLRKSTRNCEPKISPQIVSTYFARDHY